MGLGVLVSLVDRHRILREAEGGLSLIVGMGEFLGPFPNTDAVSLALSKATFQGFVLSPFEEKQLSSEELPFLKNEKVFRLGDTRIAMRNWEEQRSKEDTRYRAYELLFHANPYPPEIDPIEHESQLERMAVIYLPTEDPNHNSTPMMYHRTGVDWIPCPRDPGKVGKLTLGFRGQTLEQIHYDILLLNTTDHNRDWIRENDDLQTTLAKPIVLEDWKPVFWMKKKDRAIQGYIGRKQDSSPYKSPSREKSGREKRSAIRILGKG
jgi:hypothetical protein